MAADRRPNKKASTEDELGELHSLITKMYGAQAKSMLEKIKRGIDPEAVIGDGKLLSHMGKWVADQNSITCAAPESSGETELGQRLAQIKQAQSKKLANASGSNVIPFDDGGG